MKSRRWFWLLLIPVVAVCVAAGALAAGLLHLGAGGPSSHGASVLQGSSPSRPAGSSSQGASSSQAAGSSSQSTAVYYENKTYGFHLGLPGDWKGYQVITSTWQGQQTGSDGAVETGPCLLLRSPKWTAAKPCEDLPVMVFTHAQWDEVCDGRFTVSAAPVGPDELGLNAGYVFALPPRWEFDAREGVRELEQWMQTDPLYGTDKGTITRDDAQKEVYNLLRYRYETLQYQQDADVRYNGRRCYAFTVTQGTGSQTETVGRYLVDQHNGTLYKQNTASGRYERQSFGAEM